MKLKTMLSILIAVSAAQACGQNPVASGTPIFDRVDQNNDGIITEAEARHYPAVANVFGELDLNRDARITKDEYRHGDDDGAY